MADNMQGVPELRKSAKIHDFPHSSGISRERSFIRPQSHQMRDNGNKRRSVHNHHQNHAHQLQQQQQQRGGKPSLEIYRPPNVRVDSPNNKLNVHAKEFTMAMGQAANLQPSRSSINLSPAFHQLQQQSLQHSKSNTNMMQIRNPHIHAQNIGHHIMHTPHPQQMVPQAISIPLMTSATSAHIIQNPHRVHFKLDPPEVTPQGMVKIPGNLQRSKSVSSADALTRGLAGLGLGLGVDTPDLGRFSPEIDDIIAKASDDPNQLSARQLMDLSNALMQRAVESQRYALPAARLCIAVIARETRETFLESLVNTCRQWYQEREKVLRAVTKGSTRPRFTAFMAFLMEMFSQLKRRQLQLKTQCDGVPPPLVLLTLLCKCCEECVRPPVNSLSEIECLFFVLTCIGRDFESHLPNQLDILLGHVRDAFLNSSADPAIRRTLLQLIELQASHWQLPGPTVLYYYPSSK